jgi:hypothetical protein
MTRLAALTLVAAIAIWGLASIPDGSINDRGPPSHQRVEQARMRQGAFLTQIQKPKTSAPGGLTLVAMRPKAANASQ